MQVRTACIWDVRLKKKWGEGKDKAVTLNSSGINPVARVCLVAQCEEPESHWNSKTCRKEKLSWLKSLERVIYDKELNTTKAEET